MFASSRGYTYVRCARIVYTIYMFVVPAYYTNVVFFFPFLFLFLPLSLSFRHDHTLRRPFPLVFNAPRALISISRAIFPSLTSARARIVTAISYSHFFPFPYLFSLIFVRRDFHIILFIHAYF